ncbi:RloB family protein [Zavarzinella formosa]|uniref:RloB family protein n=1 Tax=Zavarzinella formosa TaxID=360055 RepID=UPI0012F9C454|nr:RloB family protein [Zavarzinella formosa]
MSNRNRDRKPARNTASREPKNRIFIICEGKFTEPEYLKGMVRVIRNPRVELIVREAKGTPISVVEFAKELKVVAESESKRNGDGDVIFDSFWCVFDRDEHERIPEAVQKARDSKIEVALTNEAFELWLLLHFREQPGFKSRAHLKEMLEEYITGYDKHVNYEKDFHSRYPDAFRRAVALYKVLMNIKKPVHDHNPSTSFHLLTDAIINS